MYYEKTMAALERYQTPTPEAAAIINALLADLKIITENMRERILDCSAINRQRKKYRNTCKSSKTNLSGLYFDCKTDDTLQQDKRLESEVHVTILNEPGSEFICHASPPSHNALDLTTTVLASIPPEEMNKVRVIGTDATNSNTGIDNGCITMLENSLKRKCHWNVCLQFSLHMVL